MGGSPSYYRPGPRRKAPAKSIPIRTNPREHRHNRIRGGPHKGGTEARPSRFLALPDLRLSERVLGHNRTAAMRIELSDGEVLELSEREAHTLYETLLERARQRGAGSAARKLRPALTWSSGGRTT